MGNIDVELFDESASKTVANFLNYVDDNDYADSFIHRSDPNFVIQGGGYTVHGGYVYYVPGDEPVPNEFKISNTRGTIAMAKLDGDPNSATCEWFFNLADNSANLDYQNGGFTVFGQVVNGMNTVDEIAALPIWDAGGAFGKLPLINYNTGDYITMENFVLLRIVRMSELFGLAAFCERWLDTGCSDSNSPDTWCGGTDLDYNHKVNVRDLAIYASTWRHRYTINLAMFAEYWLHSGCGWTGAGFNWCDRLDINMDGIVNFKDWAILSDQ